jgi:hypothetical protein
MKWVWRHLQGSHLMVGNLDLGWIGAGIEFGPLVANGRK